MSEDPIVTETVSRLAGQSTCLKRVIVCVLLDHSGRVIASGSNQCDPPGGICARIGVAQEKGGYPVESDCRWSHAEIQALSALPPDSSPSTAILFGHEFLCDACESALKEAGVTSITVVASGHGTGLRGADTDGALT